MAGHSKWANIKFRKAAQDAKRGKVFTKLIREITIAARMGGPEPGTNPRLRDAIDKALKANMKRDTVNNAIKRGVGGDDGANLQEISYEGYGPGGVAVLVKCYSDNKNRTVAEVRHAFSKCGGNLGTDGSVAYLFSERGELTFAPGVDDDKLMELVIEAGASDVIQHDDGSLEVVSEPAAFPALKQAVVDAGFDPDDCELRMNAEIKVDLDTESAEKLLRLIDMLEDLDDVQEVYYNAEIPEDVYMQS